MCNRCPKEVATELSGILLWKTSNWFFFNSPIGVDISVLLHLIYTKIVFVQDATKNDKSLKGSIKQPAKYRPPARNAPGEFQH